MSDGHDDRWWGDEAPVRTDRRSARTVEPVEPVAPVDPPAAEPPAGGPPHHSKGDGDGIGAGAGNGRGDRRDPLDPSQGASAPREGRPAPSEREPTRSKVQVFVPAPEDLPPFEEVVDPIYPGPVREAPEPGPGPDPGPAVEPPVADAGPPDPGPAPVPEPAAASASRPKSVFVPPPEELPPFEEVVDPIYPSPPGDVPDPGPDAAGDVPPPPVLVAGPGADVPPAPDLSQPRAARRAPASPGSPTPSPDAAPRRPVDRRRLAVVYDVEGPRVRLGVGWFLGAMAATLLHPAAAALVYAVAAGFAARQIVRAWGSVPWQADVAAGLGAVPVVAALAGTPGLVAALVLALVVAVGAASAPDGARLPGSGGRLAAAGILALSAVPAVAGGAFVLVAGESRIAAAMLLVIVSVYEMSDYIVGSGATNPVEGPLAGVTTSSLVALPMALVLVEPYDAGGLVLIGLAAAACPLGQIVASAVLPGAGAHAPALRRIDTLIVLAPVWAAAAGAL